MASKRSTDESIVDVKKVITVALEALMVNIGEIRSCPLPIDTVKVIQTLMLGTAQGFGCTHRDIEEILTNVNISLEERGIAHRKSQIMIPGIGVPLLN